MSSLNKVMLIGRFGRDPEVRYSSSGMAICSVGLATDFKKSDGEKETEWHNVVFFDKLAEIVGKYTEKGSLVYVEGRLRTRTYEKEGQKHYATEVVAMSMQMLSFKEDSEPSDNRPRSGSGTNNPRTTAGRREAPREKSKSDVPFTDMDDDIPF